MAHASLAEVETQLEIARRLNYIASADLARVLDQSGILGKQMRALRNALVKLK
jgi:four helix bundle protein